MATVEVNVSAKINIFLAYKHKSSSLLVYHYNPFLDLAQVVARSP
jgi:hypothetical protein